MILTSDNPTNCGFLNLQYVTSDEQSVKALSIYVLMSLSYLVYLRVYSSRESVSIPVSVVGSLDLSADTSTVIRPVHSSILGEKYCFEVYLKFVSPKKTFLILQKQGKFGNNFAIAGHKLREQPLLWLLLSCRT